MDTVRPIGSSSSRRSLPDFADLAPARSRSELSKRNFAAGALIDVDIAMEKRDYQRKTSRPVQHKESHGAKHPAHEPLVKVGFYLNIIRTRLTQFSLRKRSSPRLR